jgi:membrane associated rhomboid family serine protease
VIPLYDDNPTRRLPLLTVGLIVLNVIAFGLQVLASSAEGPGGASDIVMRGGLIPNELLHMTDFAPRDLVPLPFTVFTSMFMHGDLMHIGGNMLYLWIFGNNVEDEMGPALFLLFYVLSGIAAAALQVVIAAAAGAGDVPMIGASGAIAGVLGAYLVCFPRARVRSLIFLGIFVRLAWISAGWLLGIWFALQIFSSLAGGGGVAWFAHIGGFLFGALFALVFIKPRMGRSGPPPFDPYSYR